MAEVWETPIAAATVAGILEVRDDLAIFSSFPSNGATVPLSCSALVLCILRDFFQLFFQPLSPDLLPLFRTLWSLLDRILGTLKRSSGVLPGAKRQPPVPDLALCRGGQRRCTGLGFGVLPGAVWGFEELGIWTLWA